jgi:hypothetical protein
MTEFRVLGRSGKDGAAVASAEEGVVAVMMLEVGAVVGEVTERVGSGYVFVMDCIKLTC